MKSYTEARNEVMRWLRDDPSDIESMNAVLKELIECPTSGSEYLEWFINLEDPIDLFMEPYYWVFLQTYDKFEVEYYDRDKITIDEYFKLDKEFKASGLTWDEYNDNE